MLIVYCAKSWAWVVSMTSTSEATVDELIEVDCEEILNPQRIHLVRVFQHDLRDMSAARRYGNANLLGLDAHAGLPRAGFMIRCCLLLSNLDSERKQR